MNVNLIGNVALSEPVAIKSLVFYSKSIDQKDHLKSNESQAQQTPAK